MPAWHHVIPIRTGKPKNADSPVLELKIPVESTL